MTSVVFKGRKADVEPAAPAKVPKKPRCKMPRVVTIDFETYGIEDRPDYPPVPVGFSIIKAGCKRSAYYAWGHPCENNCDLETGRKALREVWESGEPLLFHNAKFDVDVAEHHLGMKPLPWERIHDTLFLLALHNPHSRSLSLKPAADELLDMPPEERDAVREWVLAHVPEAKQKPSQWGAYICKAPGALVGKYAEGDVIRTKALFEMLYPEIYERNMMEAYDRERRLLPILLRNEREGMHVDLPRMRNDSKIFLASQEKAEKWLRKRLSAPDLNFDAPKEMADVLDREGIVTEWATTKKGARSTAKATMTTDKFHDQKVAQALGYRDRMKTCLGTFLMPWMETAERSKGLIYTSWNQVRQTHGNDNLTGARTGRLSCTPNFMNIPKDFGDKGDGYVHPKFLRVPELPLLRKYILPDPGQLFGHRDYAQQELRILAHFERGQLMQHYIEDPSLDMHKLVQRLILDATGVEYERRFVKTINFGKVYGMGAGKLAERLKITVLEARALIQAYKKAIPGVGVLERRIKEISYAGKPIVTWGGREYYCEPPVEIDGRMVTFEYKLLNYLIQGSAADCTKEAMIRFDQARKHSRFLVTVHDEINISASAKYMPSEMRILNEVMRSIEFDVPMLSDGEVGENWGTLSDFKD